MCSSAPPSDGALSRSPSSNVADCCYQKRHGEKYDAAVGLNIRSSRVPPRQLYQLSALTLARTKGTREFDRMSLIGHRQALLKSLI
jgi:hypothetical protein